MVTLSLRTLRREFNAFLREKGCCSKFHAYAAKTHNVPVSNSRTCEETWRDFATTTKVCLECPSAIVGDAFDWSSTPEEDDWISISREWGDRVYNLLFDSKRDLNNQFNLSLHTDKTIY